MGHKHKSSSKPATQQQNTVTTQTSFIQPMTQQLIQQAIAGAQMPADLQYIGMNADEQAALARLTQGRDLAVNQQITSLLSGEYQQNLANAKSLQQQGTALGGKAQEALNHVQPLLTQAQGMLGNVPQWLEKQGATASSAEQLMHQGSEVTKQGQGIVEEAAEGQREIANATPDEMNEIINKFYNSKLVQDQIEQQRKETNTAVNEFVQGLNQQAISSGNMASSRAGVAQGVGTAKIMSEFQKNLVGFQTQQYSLASQNTQNYISDRLSALNQLGQSGASIINAGGQYMQGGQGLLGVAGQYGNIATGYQNAASSLSGLAGQFGQLGQTYGQLQNNYYGQSNSLNSLANTQMNQVFNNNLAIQDAQIKDAANRFAAGQFQQQQAQQQAAINYQNQAVHANESLAKLQTLLPMLNSVYGWQVTGTSGGYSQQQAEAASRSSQLGGLAGAIGGAFVGNYLGGQFGTNDAAKNQNAATGTQLGIGAMSYLGSMFA